VQMTQWAYTFSYRIHGPGDTSADLAGTAHSLNPLDEIALQEFALKDFLRGQDARDHGWDVANTVITRFTYTEVSPVPVPETSQEDGAVSRDKDTGRQDNGGV
jgi:hypothetical protein